MTYIEAIEARTAVNLARQTNRGFTLIEILVVMAILGMLAVMVAPNLFRQQASAERDFARSEISQLESLVMTYRADMGSFPDSLEDLVQNPSGSARWNGPYVRRGVPKDPWDNDYVYEADGGDFSIVSYGADGQRGGEGDDADIGLD